jgi:hypothetical protein
LAKTDGDLGLGAAELRQLRTQAIDVDAAMHPNVQQARDALGPELGSRLGDATKRLAYRRQVGFPGGGQGSPGAPAARTAARPTAPPAGGPAG